jgi:hypothetical protein
MNRRIVIIAAGAALAAIAGCGSGHPAASPAACKKAMRAEYARAIATGKKGTEPAACKGLPAAQIQRFAAEIISGG